jgi:hypothetical protein
MNKFFVIFIVLIAPHLMAQEPPLEEGTARDVQEGTAMDISYEALAPAPIDRGLVKLQDFQMLVIASLRQEFPRLSGIFTSVHSCRLPDYGPVISITMQLPAFYFTRPVLQELERRQKIAEQQANRVRSELDRAAQIFKLKAREAELQDRMQLEYGSKKNTKLVLANLEKELGDVRKTLKDLDTQTQPVSLPLRTISQDPILQEDVGLENLIQASHQQLLQRVTSTMKDVLAQRAPSLSDLKDKERITITAHINDSFLSNRERTVIFILNGSDVDSYRKGTLNLANLKNKVLVKIEEE